MTFISYAATVAFFVYSIFLLIQTHELVSNNTIGSLSLIEVTFRLYSGYVILKKQIMIDDPYLIAGQTIFVAAIIILWAVAIVLGVRDSRKNLLSFRTALGTGIMLAVGYLLIVAPIDAAIMGIGAFLIYGVAVQSFKVILRKNILSIVVSEVTIRLIGCYFVTAKVIMTGDYWYGKMQISFAVALTIYWAILIFVGHRSNEIKERWQKATAHVRSHFAPISP